VARWTSLHIYNQTNSMVEAINKPGFSFVEIIAPCPTIFERQQKFGDGLDRLRWYCDNSDIQNEASTKDVDIELTNRIIVGKFVDKDRPTYLENMNNHYRERLGDRYKIYEG
jgi:2-oxoglutarate ferredoxin oxidoreductase subunit beta